MKFNFALSEYSLAFRKHSILLEILMLLLILQRLSAFIGTQKVQPYYPLVKSNTVLDNEISTINGESMKKHRNEARSSIIVRRRTLRNKNDVWADGRWRKAELVESKLLVALELSRDKSQGEDVGRICFPSVRDCNSALATFGDGGNFLRALGLFLKMRKSATLAQTSGKIVSLRNVPAPTLVTYSTLMSRAVHVGKERLALRLWFLMKTQAEFFSSNLKTQNKSCIIPDLKAANILMNVYAKLCDIDSAKYLLSQMIHGNGTDVPRLEPNIVTYNTLLDACHKAGDLDAALEVKNQLETSKIQPDARTYTSLIASVGRKASSTSGAKDSSLAFSFLDEMKKMNIRPNGMTYSALIDTCARCGRTDMALKGLRTMLRQKQEELRSVVTSGHKRKLVLYNEVGAWTAAIDAAGKAGRLKTAMRLFYAMPKSGVLPNTITCGCLADNLLRYGRTTETLKVLMYMKQQNIAPSEVMYTSLMTMAEKIAEIENKQKWNRPELEEESIDGIATKAIDVYTTLMKTLTEDNLFREGENTQLLKVFLVFQEMRTVGTKPDLACYNALLRACSKASDVDRAIDVLKRIHEDGLVPNETSWREALKTAANACRSDLAEEIWLKRVQFKEKNKAVKTWIPSVDCFSVLLAAYIREACIEGEDMQKSAKLCKHVVTMYKDIMTGSKKRKCDKELLLQDSRSLGFILQALTKLATYEQNEKNKNVLKRVAISITKLRIWQKKRKLNQRTQHALKVVRKWEKEFI